MCRISGHNKNKNIVEQQYKMAGNYSLGILQLIELQIILQLENTVHW